MELCPAKLLFQLFAFIGIVLPNVDFFLQIFNFCYIVEV